MGKTTEIQWCDATFNPWWGCIKVSDGCKNCYANSLDKRYGGNHWGPNSERRLFGDKHWAEPLKWNKEAQTAGVRKRVFCASMADVFEDREDLEEQRDRLWATIAETPFLDWLLLTKRPENIGDMIPWSDGNPNNWWKADVSMWPNVWLGTSVENQQAADERIPHLLDVPATVRFLSCEPLLGPVDLGRFIGLSGVHTTDMIGRCANCGRVGASSPSAIVSDACYDGEWVCSEKCSAQLSKLGCPLEHRPIDWVIVGGESGNGARLMEIEHARSLVVQCKEAGVACFMKQLGGVRDKRHNIEEFPEDLQVRDFPVPTETR